MFENVSRGLRAKNAGKLPFEDQFRKIRQKMGSLAETQMMSADLLFMVTYMASITTANATRPEIFAYTAVRKEYVPSKYIAKVEFFVKRWNYSYVQALTVIAERTKNEMLRSMMDRYANSIESGVPDEDFLTRELATIRSVYRNTYEQGLEMLKKWGDAYIAMMFAASLVGIIMMVSVAIFTPDNLEQTFFLSYFVVLAVAVFGVFTMYRAVPTDQKTHKMERGSREQEMIHSMEKKIVPINLLCSLVIFILVPNSFGLVLLFMGSLLLPLGIIGYLDDQNIISRDAEFTTFIRSLGAVMGGKGITIGAALKEIDRKSLNVLAPLINGIFSKLNLGLDEKLSWNKFTRESGSNLIYKYLNIFRDSVELGGSPDKIGQISSTSMLEQVLLREKRNTNAMGFVVLLIPMHAMMVAIFLFLYHILLTMSHAITSVMESIGTTGTEALGSSGGSIGGSMASSINMFVNFPEAAMNEYVIVMITIITVVNILAGKVVMGGDRYIYYFFASILLSITGVIFIVAPIVVGMFFSIPVFTQV